MLIVCTGNICRSPLGEQLLRARLHEHEIAVEVHSAGTRAMVGSGMTPEAALVARRYGSAGDEHVARQLTEHLVSASDLVLTATREQRSTVVALYPRAARYTYTINQFARLIGPAVDSSSPLDVEVALDGSALAESSGAHRLRALVAEVAATRGFSPPPAHPADDDIEDPYRRPAEVYERVGVLVDGAVTTIVGAFATAVGRI